MAQIRCVVERITYQNPENGYSVFRVKVKGIGPKFARLIVDRFGAVVALVKVDTER